MVLVLNNSKYSRENVSKQLDVHTMNVTKDEGAFYTPIWLATHTILNVLNITDMSKARKTVDLACGEGAFLIAYLKLLQAHNVAITKEHISNLYGFDVDEKSIKITRKNILDFLKPLVKSDNKINEYKAILNKNIKNVNIYDFKKKKFVINGQDFNYFFDLVIGNPPWRISRDRADYDESRDSWSFARHDNDEDLIKAKKNWKSNDELKEDKDIYLTFLDVSKSIISSKGKISMILPDSFLRNTNSSELRINFMKSFELKIEEFNNTGKAFDIDSRKKFIVLSCLGKALPNNKIKYSSGNKASKVGLMGKMNNTMLLSVDELIINSQFAILPDIRSTTEKKAFLSMHEWDLRFKHLLINKAINSKETGSLTRGADIQLLSLENSESQNKSSYFFWRKISKDDNTRTLLTLTTFAPLNYDKNSVHGVQLSEESAIWTFAFMNSIWADFYIKTQMTVNITKEMLFELPIPNKSNYIGQLIFALVAVKYFDKNISFLRKNCSDETIQFAKSFSKYLKDYNDVEYMGAIDYLFGMLINLDEESILGFVDDRFRSFVSKYPGYRKMIITMIMLVPFETRKAA